MLCLAAENKNYVLKMHSEMGKIVCVLDNCFEIPNEGVIPIT
jgi:hypothetical protein